MLCRTRASGKECGERLLVRAFDKVLSFIGQADDSGLSDKVLPKMLKTYCSPIEILIYMGIQ